MFWEMDNSFCTKIGPLSIPLSTKNTETPVLFSLFFSTQNDGIKPRYFGKSAECRFKQPFGAKSIKDCLNIWLPAIEINKSGL